MGGEFEGNLNIGITVQAKFKCDQLEATYKVYFIHK